MNHEEKEPLNKGQMELGLKREPEPDRNLDLGGRSFYFFDLDDNVLFLSTQIYLYKKSNNHEISVSTKEYGRWSHAIGKYGPYKEYYVDFDPDCGSFRRFRDQKDQSSLSFLEDLDEAVNLSKEQWAGPSWNCFYHAVYNGRPLALITARGHSPETIMKGFEFLCGKGVLPKIPNYLSILPVTHPDTRKSLGDATERLSVSELKKIAVRESVQRAMNQYGKNPFHRFGISDDSPENLAVLRMAMISLKKQFPENAFYLISTHREKFSKQEIFLDHIETTYVESAQVQLDLF